eukprot:TRINITY_DN31551_c0_g1_i1.p1 TRINITY_DN31551_c0_g1~~TRINITY_DN31551_c0_g1_i1.p1  ORF type:complete len:514 (+),score=82.39 TRINITY_DN31551_c0_g1_i1:86-1543(+)
MRSALLAAAASVLALAFPAAAIPGCGDPPPQDETKGCAQCLGGWKATTTTPQLCAVETLGADCDAPPEVLVPKQGAECEWQTLVYPESGEYADGILKCWHIDCPGIVSTRWESFDLACAGVTTGTVDCVKKQDCDVVEVRSWTESNGQTGVLTNFGCGTVGAPAGSGKVKGSAPSALSGSSAVITLVGNITPASSKGTGFNLSWQCPALCWASTPAPPTPVPPPSPPAPPAPPPSPPGTSAPSGAPSAKQEESSAIPVWVFPTVAVLFALALGGIYWLVRQRRKRKKEEGSAKERAATDNQAPLVSPRSRERAADAERRAAEAPAEVPWEEVEEDASEYDTEEVDNYSEDMSEVSMEPIEWQSPTDGEWRRGMLYAAGETMMQVSAAGGQVVTIHKSQMRTTQVPLAPAGDGAGFRALGVRGAQRPVPRGAGRGIRSVYASPLPGSRGPRGAAGLRDLREDSASAYSSVTPSQDSRAGDAYRGRY